MNSWSKRIMILVTGFYWFSMYTYVPTLAPYAQSLGASYDMVGFILGSYGFTQVLLRLPVGVFSDAWGRRKLFVIGGIALAVCSSLGMWLVPAVGALLLLRASAGVAAAAWVDYTVLYASYFQPKEAPKAIGFINAVCSLGQVAAMLAGGYVAERFGLTSPFILGAAGGLIGVALSFSVREEPSAPKPVDTAVMFDVLRDDNLLRLSGLGVILQVVTYVTIFGFSPVAAQAIGAGGFELGLLTVAAIVPSIFASALSGTLFCRRYGERSTLVGGFITMAASCLVIPFIDNLSWFYLSQAVGGFGRGLIMPLLMGLSIKNFPDEKRSTAMGIFQAIYGIGMCGGPVLAGLLSSSFGLAWGFWVTGIVGFAGAGLASWGRYLPLDRGRQEVSPASPKI
ncbi:MAG: MFS transporter [Negativicutes bacterium]|nr:MFS transporter [Negativicutes bacterium]